MTHADLKAALQIFGLTDRITLKDVKRRHRELVRKYHPDSGGDEDPRQIRLINEAYAILLEYITNYHYSFSEDEFYEQNPDERLRRQFAYDPIWGSKG